MMAAWGLLGMFFLVLLCGGSYSLPINQAGPPPYSTYGGSYEAFADPGYVGYDQYAPSSYSAPRPRSFGSGTPNLPQPQPEPYEEPMYNQPSAQGQPGVPADTEWAVAPLSVSPPFPPPPPFLPSPPKFQAGELSKAEETLEFHDEERETQEQRISPPPPPYRRTIFFEPRFPDVPPPRFGAGLLFFPYDYMFLTGQYPPGTLAYFSNSYEQGRDHWSDVQYVREHRKVPTETKPSNSVPQQSMEQPSQPLAQSVENDDQGQSGAQNGQVATSGGSGVKAPHPRAYHQPRWFGPPTHQAGRYVSQVGY